MSKRKKKICRPSDRYTIRLYKKYTCEIKPSNCVHCRLRERPVYFRAIEYLAWKICRDRIKLK